MANCKICDYFLVEVFVYGPFKIVEMASILNDFSLENPNSHKTRIALAQST